MGNYKTVFLTLLGFFSLSLIGMEPLAEVPCTEKMFMVRSHNKKKYVKFPHNLIYQSSVLYEQYLKKIPLKAFNVSCADLCLYKKIKESESVNLSSLSVDQVRRLTVASGRMGDSLLTQHLIYCWLPLDIINTYIRPRIISPVISYIKHNCILSHMRSKNMQQVDCYSVKNKAADCCGDSPLRNSFFVYGKASKHSVHKAIMSVRPWKLQRGSTNADEVVVCSVKRGKKNSINYLLSDNASVLITWPVSSGGSCMLWRLDIDDSKSVEAFFVQTDECIQGNQIRCVQLSPTGRYVVIILISGRVVLFDGITGQKIINKKCVTNTFLFPPKIAFSSNEKLLCIAGLMVSYRGRTHGIEIFDTKTGEGKRVSLTDWYYPTNDLCLTEDDRHIIAFNACPVQIEDDTINGFNVACVELYDLKQDIFFESLKKEDCTLFQAYNLYCASKGSEMSSDKNDKRHALFMSALRSFITNQEIKNNLKKLLEGLL